MTGSQSDEFDGIVAELLVVPPTGFVAARDARADAVGGDLGRGIRALRKPTLAAWATNLLSRDDMFRDAMALSAELREAQDDLDRAELARLGAQRRQLVRALAQHAVDLAAQAGVGVSAAAASDVERTLNAAIVDPIAGGVVAAGRLLRPLDPGALDAEELAAVVAGSVPGAPAPPEAHRDDLAARRARREHERARREATQAVAAARRDVDRVDAQLVAARERADRLHERAEDLRRDLARVSSDAETADEAVAALEAQRHDRASVAAAAARDLDRLERRADG